MTTESTLTLEDVRELSEEVRLLVEAHLPLEQHLAAAGRGHSQRLQLVTQTIIDGLNRGTSLENVIEQECGGASRMLASAVAAGVRTGNLAATIEMMGDFAGDLIDLRRQILQAISYPLVILTVAWALFALVIQHALSRVLMSSRQLEIALHPVLHQLLQWNADYPQWIWTGPALAAGVIAFWVYSGRASSMAFRGPERLLLLLPGVGTLVRDLRFYTLSRMLTLLIERQVTLPEALLLAGSSCGSDSLRVACRDTARQIENGIPDALLSGDIWRRGRLPPLLQTCLRHTTSDGGRFLLRLQAVTEHYHERLRFNTIWLKTILPVALFVVLGGGAVVMYATAVFWPVIEIYQNLGNAA